MKALFPIGSPSVSARVLCQLVPLLLGLACFGDEPQPAALKQKTDTNVKNIGVEEFDRLRTDRKAITLDVRTPSEYANGHVPGAVNIDYASKDFAEKIAALDRSHPYLVHCAAGIRSSKACERMSKLNFTNLYNLDGGFKAWQKAGKPVEKTPFATDKSHSAEE